MAESSYPSPGVTQLQHERLLGTALASGLRGHPDDSPLVYADGVGTREVRIRANRQAAVEGYGWQNDAVEITKTLASNGSGSTRVDLVVLRLDRSTWTVTVQVVQGTPGAGTPAATQQTGSTGVWELPLAAVSVAPGASTLAAGTVTELGWYLGQEGQILCKAGTRPPHAPGRRIWQTDTGRAYLSTGVAWLPDVDDAAVTVPMATGFTASRNTVSRRNGLALFQMVFSRPAAIIAAGATVTVATIPEGFRPATDIAGGLLFVPSSGGGGTYAVSTTGAVTVTPEVNGVNANRSISLHPLTWPVA